MRFPRLSRGSLAALLVALALGAGACSDGAAEPSADAGGTGDAASAAGPPAATVELRPATFEPASTTVHVGDTVRWTWAGGGLTHNVSGPGFKSRMQAKGRFDHTFAEAGTFAYRCDVHPTTMKGTVQVEA